MATISKATVETTDSNVVAFVQALEALNPQAIASALAGLLPDVAALIPKAAPELGVVETLFKFGSRFLPTHV